MFQIVKDKSFQLMYSSSVIYLSKEQIAKNIQSLGLTLNTLLHASFSSFMFFYRCLSRFLWFQIRFHMFHIGTVFENFD